VCKLSSIVEHSQKNHLKLFGKISSDERVRYKQISIFPSKESVITYVSLIILRDVYFFVVADPECGLTRRWMLMPTNRRTTSKVNLCIWQTLLGMLVMLLLPLTPMAPPVHPMRPPRQAQTSSPEREFILRREMVHVVKA
jgi:hypothetical protein